MKTEYLPLVTEEAGEVLQAIGKVQRFGSDNRWERQGCSNLEALAYEVGDLLEVIDCLDLPEALIEEGRIRKREKLKVYGPNVWRGCDEN